MGRALSILLAAFALAGPVHADRTLQVEDAWVREGPPSARVLAGFMVLRNMGSEAVTIVGASSARFARIELHMTQEEGGLAKMMRQEQVTVPAGGVVQLAPGGYHLMLFDPAEAVRAGERIALELHTRGGDTIGVEAEVRRGAGMGGGAHHHH